MTVTKVSAFKPMLAGMAPEPDAVKYPVIASPKIDGIRCLTTPQGPMSRSLKPIPNQHVWQELNRLPPGLDGELWVRGARTFGEVSSAIMASAGEPDFEYHVFDHFRDPVAPYRHRLCEVHDYVRTQPKKMWLRAVDSRWIKDSRQLRTFIHDCLAQDYEGVMIRDPNGRYKFGRSTTKEGLLLKVKPYEDAEAVVIGFEERRHNTNPALLNALGRTERSSHKAGRIPAGDLGKLVCVRQEDWQAWCDGAGDRVTFGIGAGFTDDERERFWKERGDLPGRIVKFKHQVSGAKDAPRIPVFLAFRDERDMGE